MPPAGKQGTGSTSKRGKAEPSPGKQRTIASFFARTATCKLASPESSVPQNVNEVEAKADLPLNGHKGQTTAQLQEEADTAAQATKAAADGDDKDVVSLLEEDGDAAMKSEEGEGGAAVKLEEGKEPLAPQKRPRQLGAFATASAPSVGVSNALIEKRKAGMRKAGGAQETTAAEEANGKAAKKEAEEAVTWQEGTLAPYLVIARAFAAMESTTKRLAKDNIMVEMFRSVLRCSPGKMFMYTFCSLDWTDWVFACAQYTCPDSKDC